MKKLYLVALVLLLVGLAAAAGPSYAAYYAKDKNDAGRLLTGRVIDHQDNPLPGAVVYLSNTRTRAVKTAIVGQDGGYRFPALSPNIDYEVYAQFNGKKSDTKTVSQFDNRQQVNINLRIDAK
ncbi:MAG: carboxypeptidase-like regulatory domain-containing protein [Acidobacteriia bacterium]|nr:carboxypeptidase-like regulatory domain-containing protein [Terriglobia bacterium]